MIHLQRPLVVALLAFLAGLLASLRLAPPPLLALAAFTGMAAMALPKLSAASDTRLDGPLLLALFFLSGGAVGAAAARDNASDCRLSIADGQRVVARGLLGAEHREGAAGAGAPLLPLIGATVENPSGCGGELRIRMPPGVANLPVGTAMTVAGEWRTFSSVDGGSPWPRNPLYAGFVAGDSLAVHDAGEGAGPWLSARSWADARFAELFPHHLPLVEALILNRREYVDPAIRDRYTNSGLSHLLAISGTHVALLAAVLILVGAVARASRSTTVLATLALVWLYMLVIGAPASAVRSGVMITVALCASLLQRPTAFLAGVAAAAFAILALTPLAILDPGFQLSFLGVLGMFALRPPIVRRLPDGLVRRGIARHVTDAVVVGVAAFLATAPVVAHHFGTVAPVAIIAGLPALPLMSLALIGAAAALVLHPLFPPLARIVADGAALFLDMLDLVATWAADLPFGHSLVPPPPWWMWGAALAAAFIVFRLGTFGGPTLRRTAASGAAIAIFLLWPIAARAGAAGLEIHFIDVGQGDAIALRTPDARWILVDAGPASADYDAGERRVVPFLRQKGARALEAVVLTHPDLDHIGGAPAVLRAISTQHVFEPGLPVGRGPYLELLQTVESYAVDWRAARAGRSLELDGVRFDFLWPDPETIDASREANHISAVIMVTYGEFTMLLTGDAGVEVEDVLVDRYGDAVQADVLKLGHHGSATSSSGRFLDAVSPELAVVSAGRRNRYGHPAPVVVEAVEARSIDLARTDREGTISLVVEPGGAEWRKEEW